MNRISLVLLSSGFAVLVAAAPVDCQSSNTLVPECIGPGANAGLRACVEWRRRRTANWSRSGTSVTPIATGAAPLSLVQPQGVPGCDLLVAPDLVEAIVTTTGTATSQLCLPNSPLLIGATFHHQMVPIEIDPSLAFLALTATNALTLTAGAIGRPGVTSASLRPLHRRV